MSSRVSDIVLVPVKDLAAAGYKETRLLVRMIVGWLFMPLPRKALSLASLSMLRGVSLLGSRVTVGSALWVREPWLRQWSQELRLVAYRLITDLRL